MGELETIATRIENYAAELERVTDVSGVPLYEMAHDLRRLIDGSAESPTLVAVLSTAEVWTAHEIAETVLRAYHCLPRIPEHHRHGS